MVSVRIQLNWKCCPKGKNKGRSPSRRRAFFNAQKRATPLKPAFRDFFKNASSKRGLRSNFFYLTEAIDDDDNDDDHVDDHVDNHDDGGDDVDNDGDNVDHDDDNDDVDNDDDHVDDDVNDDDYVDNDDDVEDDDDANCKEEMCVRK